MYVGNGGGTDVGETGVGASGFFIVPVMSLFLLVELY